MGHYYSEMHVPKPHETWNDAFDKSLREMGFGQIKIEFKTFYVCNSCGCLVAMLGQHLWRCPAGDKSAEVDQMVDRAKDLILGLHGPIELLKLVQLAGQNGVSVYALSRAIDALVARQKIVRQRNHTKPYQDTIIARVEQPEEA